MARHVLPISNRMLTNHKLLTLFMVATLAAGTLNAQTPVANRVRAMAGRLPQQAAVVAKYTDVKRHCLYYTLRNRLYVYDVLANRRREIHFADNSYKRIFATWLSPDGNYLFIAVDRGPLSFFYLKDGQQLWRYNSYSHRSLKVGQGFCIARRKGCFKIKQAWRCLNPNAQQRYQHWTARDHYFDLYGNVIFALGEYKIEE